MAKGKASRKGGLGSRLRRILGTDYLGRQAKLLADQNRGLKKLNDEVHRLRDLVAAQEIAIKKSDDRKKSVEADLLSVQREIVSLSKRSLKIENRQQARLDQISYSLFELNRTLYSMYKRDDFDLGSSGAGFFSQNGEDGIIGEIANRLNIELTTFVEIGTGDGTENNSIQLLLGGARGIWIEADASCVENIRGLYADALEKGHLKVVQSQVNAENIDDVLGDAGAGGEVDFLSLDIDGNDYWVWKALSVVSPKILCLEYNAFYGPNISWTKKYQSDFMWPGRNIYYGASLKALEKLSRTKGFTLVACDYSGVNAFFVRSDLLNEAFKGPFTAEHLFQPFRGTMGRRPPGKEFHLGAYENV